MNKFSKLSIIFLAVFFCFTNVLCFRKKSNVTDASHLENEASFEERLRGDLHSFINESTSLEVVGDHIATAFTNQLFAQLQSENDVSFLQSEFNIKEEMKKNAKTLLLTLVKTGLEPFEAMVAKAVKPPTTSPQVYSLLSKVLIELFNKVEAAVKVPVSDEIWLYEAPVGRGGLYDDDEDEDDYDDDDLFGN